jgi:hypothetical protein
MAMAVLEKLDTRSMDFGRNEDEVSLFLGSGVHSERGVETLLSLMEP